MWHIILKLKSSRGYSGGKYIPPKKSILDSPGWFKETAKDKAVIMKWPAVLSHWDHSQCQNKCAADHTAQPDKSLKDDEKKCFKDSKDPDSSWNNCIREKRGTQAGFFWILSHRVKWIWAGFKKDYPWWLMLHPCIEIWWMHFISTQSMWCNERATASQSN